VSQNSSDQKRRFILTTRGPRPIDIMTIWINSDGGSVAIWPEPLPDVAFKVLHGGRPYTATADEADEEWVRSTLQQIMSAIDRR
jgi:hypothetical protein